MIVGSSRYVCGDEERRAVLRDRLEAGQTALNGIDFLEVVDLQAVGQLPATDAYRQRILLIQCFTDAPTDLLPENVRISGGVRIKPVRVRWVRRMDDLHQTPGSAQGVIPPEVRTLLASPAFDHLPRSRVLALGTDAAGDYSTYRLELRNSATDPSPLPAFDRRLGATDFSFKVECPSPLDCRTPSDCPPPHFVEPDINYLAKDYRSFRRLMLDRLSTTVPDWEERHPADLGVTLVELLAYVGDHLSYFQDAAATEAYLGTARRRISVRRHARLVDYFIDEGACSRTWIVFEAKPGADGTPISGPRSSPDRLPGTPLLTRLVGRPSVLDPAELDAAVRAGATVFETMHEVTLRSSLNRIPFYTWSDKECCLPAGATRATLSGELSDLRRGDFLLFEEVLGPRTGSPADADPGHRHVIRIIEIEYGEDDLLGTKVTEIRWHEEDALPFPLCLSSKTEDQQELVDVSVVFGNVVLADHGRTLVPANNTGPDGKPRDEWTAPVDEESFRPVLSEGPLTHAAPLPEGFVIPADVDVTALDPSQITPAARAFNVNGSRAEPEIHIESPGQTWLPTRDLLSSGPFAETFVAEIEDDGRSRLRFGDDRHGLRPARGTRLAATYRIGNGPDGNVGAEALAHVVRGSDPGILTIRNPIAAAGGRRPESLEDVRQYAPQAFRRQERAVTEQDYARAAERHPEVSKASATFRWTGSWMTVFVTVDRRGGLPVDAEFEQRIIDHLGRYRMAGFDLEVDGPRFVPLDLALHVCVAPGYQTSDVARELRNVLGCRLLPDRRRGFFHPDDWTFGQPVYLSAIYSIAAGAAGVESVTVTRFQHWDREAQNELQDGILPIGRLEIARLDNDPSQPEHGRLELALGGGR